MTQEQGNPIDPSDAGNNTAQGNNPPDTGSVNEFDKGYGKGADKGRREVLETLGFKSLDEAAEAIKARKQAEVKALEEQNKYKELYEQHKEEYEVFKADAELWKKDSERWTDYKQAKRESLLENLTDDDKEIYGNLPLEALEKHVSKLATVRGTTTPPPGGGGAKVIGTVPEAAAAYARGEITIQEYAKIRSKNLPGAS